jgi:hypothetical protein
MSPGGLQLLIEVVPDDVQHHGLHFKHSFFPFVLINALTGELVNQFYKLGFGLKAEEFGNQFSVVKEEKGLKRFDVKCFNNVRIGADVYIQNLDLIIQDPVNLIENRCGWVVMLTIDMAKLHQHGKG